MGQIFISYSRRDTQIVDRIAASMKDAGLDFWIDREDIKAGNTWRVQIVQAIDTCDAFVLMLSPNSAASDNVRKEIDLGQDSGRKMFVVMLEPTDLPAEIRYQLAGLQFIDVKMVGYDKAVSQLTAVLKEQVEKTRPTSPKTRQAEVVIQGVDLKAFGTDQQEKLLDFISKLANADRSQLKIADLAAGSIHAFIEMPRAKAWELKTLALNRDKRFKKFHINAIRLAGNKQFIDTASGILTPIPIVKSSGFLKILVILITFVVVVGLGIGVATVIIPVVFPSPTPTLTSTPTGTPTLTPSPTNTDTPTPSMTPTLDLTPNGKTKANVVYKAGTLGELRSCIGNQYEFVVQDELGVSQVFVQFSVGGKAPDYSNIAATLPLTYQANADLWSGVFNDTISQHNTTTYWWVVVVDNFKDTFVYQAGGKFNYYAGEISCP